MRSKILSLVAAVLLVAACETSSTNTATDVGNGGKSTIVPGSQEDLRVNVGDRVFFGFDRYDLTPEGRAILDKQAKWLQTYPQVTVTVEGHADERGTREYNLALGERRANAVKKYMTAQGVNTARVSTISYGKERPEVLGSGEAVWAQNRRGVTQVN
ncbi:MAG TPA: peptidoglycan-associated lipoprotein Pal [Azospirillaceae bacterium]|nr:peptidoglycan-associated lipoprotein Pal [Azospirillaceae bacterium]